MPIFYPPIPPVPIQGAQPYAKRPWYRGEDAQEVDNPPFTYGGPYSMPIELAILSQPNPWVYAFMGRMQPFASRKLPIDYTAVPENDPPFNDPGRTIQETALIASIAQPDPWTYTFFGQQGPFLPMRMAPDIPGFSIDQPPFRHRGRTETIQAQLIDVWQPDPWLHGPIWRQPYDYRKLPPSITAVRVDNPPFDRRRLAQMMVGMPQAWAPFPPLPWHLQATFKVQLSRAKGYILG